MDIINPGIPPSRNFRVCIDTLLEEWKRFEQERTLWEYKRADMQDRIQQLDSECRSFSKVRYDLMKRIKMLEYALRQERAKRINLEAHYEQLQKKTQNNQISSVNSVNSTKLTLKPFNRSASMSCLPSAEVDKETGIMILINFLEENGFSNKAQNIRKKHNIPITVKVPEKSVKKGVKFQQKLVNESPQLETKESHSHFLPDDIYKIPTSSDQPIPSKEISNYPKVENKETPPDASLHNLNVNSRFNTLTEIQHALEANDDDNVKMTLRSTRMILRSHMDSIRSLSWHPQLPVLATTSEDGTCKLWNLTSYLKKEDEKRLLEPIYTYRGHQKLVSSCCIDVHRNLVITGGADSAVICWQLLPPDSVKYGKYGSLLYFQMCQFLGHSDSVWSVLSHPRSNTPLVFSASSDGLVNTWMISLDKRVKDDNSLVSSFKHSHEDSSNYQIPTTLTISPCDTTKLMVGYVTGDIVVVDIETSKNILVMRSPSPSIVPSCLSLCSHPSLPLIFSGNSDCFIRYWDFNAGCVSTMRAHNDIVTSVSMHPNGRLLASSSADCGIRLWDIAYQTCCQSLASHETHRQKYDEGVHSISFHPSLKLFASGAADAICKIYDVEC